MVKNIAAKLRKNGIEVRLDQWHDVPQAQLTAFMEKEISQNDYVLIFCCPKYKHRSEGSTWGGKYEGDIVTSNLYTGKLKKKFIPVLFSANWDESAPKWIKKETFIDLYDDNNFEDNFEKLLEMIKDKQ